MEEKKSPSIEPHNKRRITFKNGIFFPIGIHAVRSSGSSLVARARYIYDPGLLFMYLYFYRVRAIHLNGHLNGAVWRREMRRGVHRHMEPDAVSIK